MCLQILHRQNTEYREHRRQNMWDHGKDKVY